MEWFWTMLATLFIAFMSVDRSKEAKRNRELDLDIDFHDLGK